MFEVRKEKLRQDMREAHNNISISFDLWDIGDTNEDAEGESQMLDLEGEKEAIGAASGKEDMGANVNEKDEKYCI